MDENDSPGDCPCLSIERQRANAQNYRTPLNAIKGWCAKQSCAPERYGEKLVYMIGYILDNNLSILSYIYIYIHLVDGTMANIKNCKRWGDNTDNKKQSQKSIIGHLVNCKPYICICDPSTTSQCVSMKPAADNTQHRHMVQSINKYDSPKRILLWRQSL